jgi:hypothetical protein
MRVIFALRCDTNLSRLNIGDKPNGSTVSWLRTRRDILKHGETLKNDALIPALMP